MARREIDVRVAPESGHPADRSDLRFVAIVTSRSDDKETDARRVTAMIELIIDQIAMRLRRALEVPVQADALPHHRCPTSRDFRLGGSASHRRKAVRNPNC